MKADKASKTAQYMALFRALETNRKAKTRLFADPYAISFLTRRLRLTARCTNIPAIRNWVGRIIHKKIPGAFSSGVARTRYIDDILKHTIKTGVQQVIILGAGYDTRALRLDFLQRTPVIEIDHPNTSKLKMDVLKKKLGKLPTNVTYCQIDFNKQELNSVPVDISKTTTVIWEGVTNYLTADAVSKTFSFIGKLPRGSYVIFTYVHKKVLENPGQYLGGEKLLSDLQAGQEPWTFGFLPEELPAYLTKFNFSLVEDLGAVEYRNRYMAGRSEEGYEFYRVATAVHG